MALSYPTPTRISPPDSLRKYRFTVSELPDTILDYGSSTGFPEEIWSESGFKGAWSAHSTRNGTTFELACWNKPWNWDGSGIGFWKVPEHDESGPSAPGSGYPPNVIVVDADPTGVEDATAAFQFALDSAINFESEVVFPPGRFKITNTLYCGQEFPGRPLKNGIRITGANGPHGAYDGATTLEWHGEYTSSPKPLLWLSGWDFLVQGFRVMPFTRLQCAIMFGRHYGASQNFNSRSYFRGLTLSNANQEPRRLDYGLMLGGLPSWDTNSFGNIENCVVEDCNFNGAEQAGLAVYWGQPINTTVSRCAFRGYTRNATAPGQVGGRGIHIYGSSFTGRVSNTDFQSLEAWVTIDGTAHLVIDGGESENCKVAVHTAGPASRSACGLSVRGMRVVPDKIDLPSLGPAAFPADFNSFFLIYNGQALTLDNNIFQLGDSSRPFYVQQMAGSSIVSRNNWYPNTQPFYMSHDYTDTMPQGVVSQGDVGQNNPAAANSNQAIPSLNGTVNPSGSVVVNGTAAGVAFSVSEIDTSYKVSLQASGPYTAWVTNKTPLGFTVNVSPSQTDATVSYQLWR
jgi:hypothetical protein